MTRDQIRELVATFVEATKRHHEATMRGEWRQTNVQAKRLAQAFRRIVQIGESGRQALLAEVDNKDPVVAGMAATYSLKYDPIRSQTALRRVAREPGLVGSSARQSLKNWEEGRWHLEEEIQAMDSVAGSILQPLPGREAGAQAMDSATKSTLRALSRRIAWHDIAEFDRLNKRVMAIDWLYGDIIGMGDGWVEWCPNNEPPAAAETLAWWWVARPDLGNEIAKEADEEFREIISDYRNEGGNRHGM